MTNTPEPGSFTPAAAVVPWWWQQLDSDGKVVTPADGRQEFPTRSDAESWVGEFYPDLVDEGVASVTLFEGDREVYGPMSLGT
ncbi:MAG: hypothetical protein JWP74_2841 [Marmoricola sp.]|nr:hypothetical protein [Marmoricola sp.]